MAGNDTGRSNRVAIVGAGLIGRRHAVALESIHGIDLCAIVDPSDTAREFAAAIETPWYPSLEGLLAKDRPDGVVVAAPNQLHVSIGLTALAAGIPLFVEKPIADDVNEGEKLVQAAEKAGVPMLIGHHRRHNPLIAAAKNAIGNGRLGRIVAVHGMFWLYKPDDYFDSSWRRQKGAGPTYINLIHDIDLMRYLVGEITEVTALESNATRGFAVEDTASILLRFSCGALGTFSVTDTAVAPWSWELTSSENPAYPETGQACYYIGGTHGSLELPTNRIWYNADKRGWWEPIVTDAITSVHVDPLVAQMENFRDVILGRTDPVVPGIEGLETLKVIEAIKRSATTKKTISI